MRDDADHPATRELSKYWVLAVLLAVFAIYAPSLGNGFVLDDKTVACAVLPNGEPNAMAAEIQPLSSYFTRGYWGGNAGTKTNLFRPITVLSYAVTNSWCGTTAFPHHLLNVLLHVWGVFLAFQLLTRLAVGRVAALLGAATFGCHAIHSEVVAGIVGRAELLAFCLGAQALLLLVSTPAEARRTRLAKTVAGAALLFLAFCSKESALAWAPFLVVYAIADDVAHRRSIAPSRALAAFTVAVLPALVFWLIRTAAVGEITTVIHYYANPLAHADTTTRIASGVMIWGFGLFKCALPFPLLSDYGPVTFELAESLGDPRFLIGAVTLLATLLVGLAGARRHPLVFLAMACFLGFGFATSNLLFPIGTIFAERLYFTPSLATGILVAWAASRFDRRWVIGGVAVWILCSTAIVLGRNNAWASDVHLFASDVDAGTRCVRVLDQRALQLRSSKEPGEADELWRRAIELDPLYADALFNFASHLGATRQFGEAESLFLRAIAVPDARSGRRHIYRRDLSVLYELTNRKLASVEQLRLAWREDSAFEEVWEPLVERSVNHLTVDQLERIVTRGEARAAGHATWPFLRGILAHRRGEFRRAVAEFRRAATVRPGHAWTRLELGRSLIAAGQRSAGIRILGELAKDPDAPERFRREAVRMAR